MLHPCSRTFAGAAPFSEAETSAVADFLQRHNDSLLTYLAYHTYSQYWMLPYAYTATSKPPNNDELVTDAIRHSQFLSVTFTHIGYTIITSE